MKIENFKIKVSSEQSKIVQEVLLKNKCCWINCKNDVVETKHTNLFFNENGLFQDSGMDEDYFNTFNAPELTFSDFVTKHIELPEEYIVECKTGDECNEVVRVANSKINIYGAKYVFVSHRYNIGFTIWNKILPEYKNIIILTYEVWKILINKNKAMERKIIGYKCPMVLHKGCVSVGTIFTKYDDKDFYNSSEYRGSGLLMLPAEIVKQWEAVYEEPEFKKDEWLYYKDIYNEKFEYLFRYSHINDNNVYHTECYPIVRNNFGSQVYNSGCFTKDVTPHITKATPEQIERILKIVALHKGFKEENKFNPLIYPSKEKSNYIQCIKKNSIFAFHKDYDIFSINDFNIYIQGEWAEIIPDVYKSCKKCKFNDQNNYCTHPNQMRGCDNFKLYEPEVKLPCNECTNVDCKSTVDCPIILRKKQTVEEAAEEYTNNGLNGSKLSFIAGATWQKQQL